MPLDEDELQEQYTEQLNKLGERFHPGEVKQRRGGNKLLDYVDIPATIKRLNAVLGSAWSFEIDRSSLTVLHTLPNEDPNKAPKFTYCATVQGHLVVFDGRTHGGVGADVDTDPDKALKTAHAEAIKKAAHQLEVALYLWDEGERDTLALQRQAEKGDVEAVKQLVVRRAWEEGLPEEFSREDLAAHFDIDESELDDEDLLRKLAGV